MSISAKRSATSSKTIYQTYVPSEGNKHAKIAIVGESPGRQEAQARRPFVGTTGKQLNKFLEQVGLRREDLFITNAVKYLPQGDKEKFFFKGNAPTEVYIEGIEELKKELEEVRPNVVVPMGNYALFALTGLDSIMKYRGSILESTLIPGLKVIPALHPSYILRVWKEYPLLIWDLQRAKDESESPDINLPRRNIIINPSQSEIDEAVTRLSKASIIAIDTEWFSPDDLSCIGFTDSADWAICIPANNIGSFSAYRTLLSSPCRKIFQNALFDLVYLERAGFPVKTEHNGKCLIEDTMVAHKMTWPDLRAGLDLIVSVYTREPYYKDERKIAKEQDFKDKDRYWVYNCKDVYCTFEAWEALQKEMKDFNTTAAYSLNMKALPMLHEASMLGIKCDFDALNSLQKELKEKADKNQELLSRAFDGYINVRSQKQIAGLVYGYLKAPKRKSYATDQATLMDIASQTKDDLTRMLLTLIIETREFLNARSKYINESLPDADGRIRSTWNLAGTKNGRLSASKDNFRNRGASLQTFPEEARKVCIADDGYTFIKPDQEQAEARVVAVLSNDERTLEWLEEGLDIHSKMAEQIYGIDYEECVATKPKERYVAKVCKHATNYMMGPILLKMTVNKNFHETGFGITTKEAREIRATILKNHPLERWWADVKRELGSNRILKNCYGRQRMFIDRWGETMFKDAIAFVPQSTVSDHNKVGLERVRHWLKQEFDNDPKVAILAEMHDGALIQVPKDRALDTAKKVRELMTMPITIKEHELVIPIEVAIGDCWGNMSGVE